MPRLKARGPDDVSEGRIGPTTAMDQYVATLANWFGVVAGDLQVLALNRGNVKDGNPGFLDWPDARRKVERPASRGPS